jgi:hypothetical protein
MEDTMINRALVCAILIAVGAVAVLNSKAPAETAVQPQPAFCTSAGGLPSTATAEFTGSKSE